MSYFADIAPFSIELAELKLTEPVAVCGFTSEDRFKRNEKGITMVYCGGYVVFSREGYASAAVNSDLVKTMTSAKDAEGLLADKAKLEEERRQAAEITKQLALLEMKAAEQASPTGAAKIEPQVTAAEMLKDMKADVGVLADEESLSMKAAVARAEAKRAAQRRK